MKFAKFLRAPCRSSHQSCYVWKGVLRNFAKFTGLRPGASSGIGVSCEFYKISKNTSYRIALSDCFWPYFTDHLPWLLLTVLGLQPATLLKKILAKIFFCEFCKIFKNIFWQSTSRLLLLKFNCKNSRSFSEHLYYRAPLRNCLFHVQVAEFQPADTVKNYFTGVLF